MLFEGFNDHKNLVNAHAFLSPSGYHWINYDPEKLERTFLKSQAVQRGTELHALACNCIRLGVGLPEVDQTLNLYVNDAISLGMTPEQVLFYSKNCFGTADTISFDPQHGFLRIHDLKTGETPASMHQLEIYYALFCLEYGFSPIDISGVLRIYQNNEVLFCEPDPSVEKNIMEKIVDFDRRIELLRKGDMNVH